MSEDMAREIVEASIDFLYGRKGFDDWWSDLDDDIKDELKSEWAREIRKTGTPPFSPSSQSPIR